MNNQKPVTASVGTRRHINTAFSGQRGGPNHASDFGKRPQTMGQRTNYFVSNRTGGTNNAG
jgi:hypothetical protein